MKNGAWMDAILAKVENLAPGLRRLVLVPPPGTLFPPASAGAHIMLELRAGGRIWRNAYSLTSRPGTRHEYSIIVRRVAASRGGSAYIHDHAAVGQVFSLGGPHNFFWPASAARKHLMLAGGIGVTPFLSYMAGFAESGQPYALHLRCRAEDRAAFTALIAPWPRAHVHASGTDATFDVAAVLRAQPLGTHLYLCGPESFMTHMISAARSLGWPSSLIHQEFFGASLSGRPFLVELARSGMTLSVGSDQSLLEALEAAGVDAPCLCRGGACGQCKLPVLAGQPDHHLTTAERARGDAIMTCVSRAQSDSLVLDI
jgi:ferredoxin-NADP reductase